MEAYADHPARHRVRWLARFALLWAVGIGARLVFLQAFSREEFRDLARQQQTKLRQLAAPRGSIFDRAGRILALSVPVETVIVNPLQLPDRPLAAQLLARILEIDETKLRDRLETYANAHKGYMVVDKGVSVEKADRLRQLGVDWIGFESNGVRRYPDGALGAHVLGGVDHQARGNAGIERHFEDDLGGYPGYEWVVSDVQRRSFDSSIEKAPQAGRDVVLTIDRRIQYAADEAIREAVASSMADSGTAVAMDPNTGEILALSNYPTYDPNEVPKSTADYAARKNLAATDPFEPGSIFKVFGLAAALETTDIRPDTVLHCGNGTINVGGHVIGEAHGGFGYLTVEEIIAKSSNVGAVKIALKTGDKNLHDYLLRFGFNQTTGVEMPSESQGLIFRLKRWQPGSIGSVAIGHEVLTTSLQLVRGLAAIANNGFLIRPHLTRARPLGEATLRNVVYQPEQNEQPRRILRPETAMTLRKVMESVVLNGTGKGIRLDGYSCGGKTGTAKLFDKTIGKYVSRYNASFMGFSPVSNPAVVVVVTLNGTRQYGATAAGPAFKQITQTALRVLNVPQDLTDPTPAAEPLPERSVADVAVTGAPLKTPEAMQQEMEAEQGPATAIAVGPKLPNFVGKTARAVLDEAMQAGIRVDIEGSGIARAQDPPAGGRLTAGQHLKVRFQP